MLCCGVLSFPQRTANVPEWLTPRAPAALALRGNKDVIWPIGPPPVGRSTMPANRSHLLLIVLVSSTLLAQSANPIPMLYQPLVPTSVEPGSPDLTLTLSGTGFVPTSVVKWDGIPLQTAFINSSKLVANVPASNVASPGTASITVFSPAPGGGTSNAVPFTITRSSSSLSFATSTVNVGLAPGKIKTADFNNDGKADLAVMNNFEPAPECYPFGGFGTISILLGKGDGTFSSAASF